MSGKPPIYVREPMVFQLQGIVLTPHAKLVTDHPRELMMYGRSALSLYLKSNDVQDTDEYRERACADVGLRLTQAFGHTYSVDLLDVETERTTDSMMNPIILSVHAEHNLSVTHQ
ncbi:hypothetical protein D3C87_1175250 [compost metagenome]